MLYSISGILKGKHQAFAAIEVGGMGFRVHANQRTLESLPQVGEQVHLYVHLHVRENALELYGFRSPEELAFFNLLLSVSGVGPKSALGILEIAELRHLTAAIKGGRPDLLTRASGVGKKTAERIVLELRSRVEAEESEGAVQRMESDADLVETLVELGYRREQAKAALGKVGSSATTLEERLKEALKILGGRADKT